MRSVFPVLALAALLAVTAGCSKPSTPSNNLGTVRIRMTDDPAAYDAVNLVVTQVSIHRDAPDSTGGWETLRSDTLTVDLLTLRNGVFTDLAQALVPAGHYTQLRLKLGAGSNVVVDGVQHPLVVPSGMQSGYKLVGQFDVPAGGLLDLGLDFDAARSVVVTGNGTYMLKPTCRVLPFSTAGAVDGRLLPAGTSAAIDAIVGSDTLATGSPAADGSFLLAALAPGSYTIAIHPATGFRDTALAGVAVTAQQTTHLGDIVLTPQ